MEVKTDQGEVLDDCCHVTSALGTLRSEVTLLHYITKKALTIIRRVKIVNKKEFAAAAFDLEHETYIIYIGSVGSVISPSSSILDVYPFYRSQIAGLIAKKAPTKVPAKYLDFVTIFSPDLASELPKHIEINDHAIKLVDGQQLFYKPIYSLRLIKLETLKAYIESNLANGFIRPSKLPASTPILFNQKSNSSLQLWVNY